MHPQVTLLVKLVRVGFRDGLRFLGFKPKVDALFDKMERVGIVDKVLEHLFALFMAATFFITWAVWTVAKLQFGLLSHFFS